MQKRLQGQHKQQMKKIDILEYLQEKGYDIGYTTVCNYIGQREDYYQEAFIRQVYSPGDVCEFDCAFIKQSKADKYSVITYMSNRYSVPDYLVGKIIDIKVYPERLVCYYENKVADIFT